MGQGWGLGAVGQVGGHGAELGAGGWGLGAVGQGWWPWGRAGGWGLVAVGQGWLCPQGARGAAWRDGAPMFSYVALYKFEPQEQQDLALQ